MEHRCERCGALFKGPSWRIAKTRHDGRQNPCDRPQGAKYVRGAKPVPEVFRHRLGEMDIQGLVAPSKGYLTQVVPDLLRQVFSRAQNQCIVWPNIHWEEIIVFLNQEEAKGLRRVKLDELTELVVLVVHNQIFPLLRDWSRYEEFKEWMWRTTLVDLENNVWTGDISKKCEYFQAVRTFLRDYFGRFPGKRKAMRDLNIAAGVYDPEP
jgi:hypothetical protein